MRRRRERRVSRGGRQLAAGQPHAQRLARRGLGRIAHHGAVGAALDHGVPAVEGGLRRQRADPGTGVPHVVRSRAPPARRRPAATARPAPRPVATLGDRHSGSASDRAVSASTGKPARRSAASRPSTARVQPAPGVGDPVAAPRASSGTTRRAASVGVEARTSATRSSSGASCSWPIALTTGVRQAATARTRPSSENGSRSSTEPPPRAITMTSTSAGRIELGRARRDDLGDGVRALHGDARDLELDGRPAPPGVLERRRARRRSRARR